MSQKTSIKTLVIFWLIAIPLLVGWYYFLQFSNEPKRFLNTAYNTARVLPLGDEYAAALELAHYFLQEDDQVRTYLILLQNNMELRPGGGYIGSFAIVKVKNGEVIESAVHDTANFDGRIPDSMEPPYPMKETMNIPSMKLRDSNWMPDFPSNARVAENFYQLGDGQEEFDGVIAINATVLDAILNITGPITLEKYNKTFASGDAVMELEYQVEQGYKEQKIQKGDRKVVMNDLSQEMITRMRAMSLREKMVLANGFIHTFDSKDIQLYFDDAQMAQMIESVGWDGKIDETWEKDYLMVVDANLASYKTDHVMERAIDYDVDLSGAIPQAVVTIHYENTATKKDWKTNDYQTYVRIYAPDKTWFTDISGCVLSPQYGSKYEKRYVGCLVHVPLGTKTDVIVRYNLPIDIKNHYPYDLKIQKQSGVHDVPVTVHVQEPGMSSQKEYVLTMDEDIALSSIEE